MKGILALTAFAAVCAAFGAEDEAAAFGYKGMDLEETNMLFYSTGPAVTNWVPARVLSVCEDYEFTADELALIEAAGVVTPGAPLAAMPDDYAKKYDEPWFVGWERARESFGLKGVNGVITHYNEDRRRWDTGETYFSSYWATEAEAKAALDRLEQAIGGTYHAKKFHKFEGSWIAEYVRLRVMGLVGQKPDGRWSCMLDLQDKINSGCGQWEPVPEQEARLARYRYAKALKAWKDEVTRILAENHEAVEKLAAERKLVPVEGISDWIQTDDGRNVRWLGGEYEFAPVDEGDVTNTMTRVWNEKLAVLESAVGAKFEGEPVAQAFEDGFSVKGASWKSDLYEARLDVLFPPFVKAPSAEDAASTNAPPRIPGQFRMITFELLQSGKTLPPRPQLGK